MNEHLRQTGRTARMLERAVQLARAGRAVYVLAHNPNYARQLQQRLGADLPSADPACRSIRFEAVPDEFDWTSMKISQNAHPNCAVLVDHAAVEQRLARLDEQMMYLAQLQRQLYALTT